MIADTYVRNRKPGGPRTFTESIIPLSDTIVKNPGKVLARENITIAEALSKAHMPGGPQVFSEMIPLSDTFAWHGSLHPTFTDVITLAEPTFGTVQKHFASLTDTFTVSDLFHSVHARFMALAETIALVDVTSLTRISGGLLLKRSHFPIPSARRTRNCWPLPRLLPFPMCSPGPHRPAHLDGRHRPGRIVRHFVHARWRQRSYTCAGCRCTRRSFRGRCHCSGRHLRSRARQQPGQRPGGSSLPISGRSSWLCNRHGPRRRTHHGHWRRHGRLRSPRYRRHSTGDGDRRREWVSGAESDTECDFLLFGEADGVSPEMDCDTQCVFSAEGNTMPETPGSAMGVASYALLHLIATLRGASLAVGQVHSPVVASGSCEGDSTAEYVSTALYDAELVSGESEANGVAGCLCHVRGACDPIMASNATGNANYGAGQISARVGGMGVSVGVLTAIPS